MAYQQGEGDFKMIWSHVASAFYEVSLIGDYIKLDFY